MTPHAGAFAEVHCKAADTALLCQWLEAILGEPQEGWSRFAHLSCACVRAANAAFSRMAHGPIFLTAEDAAAAHDDLQCFVVAYAALGRYALERGRLLFNQRPKLHMVHHVALDLDPGTRARVPNPAIYQTWSDEDFVGRLSRISRRTAGTTACAKRTLDRYLLALRARLRRDT